MKSTLALLTALCLSAGGVVAQSTAQPEGNDPPEVSSPPTAMQPVANAFSDELEGEGAQSAPMTAQQMPEGLPRVTEHSPKEVLLIGGLAYFEVRRSDFPPDASPNTVARCRMFVNGKCITAWVPLAAFPEDASSAAMAPVEINLEKMGVRGPQAPQTLAALETTFEPNGCDGCPPDQIRVQLGQKLCAAMLVRSACDNSEWWRAALAGMDWQPNRVDCCSNWPMVGAIGFGHVSHGGFTFVNNTMPMGPGD